MINEMITNYDERISIIKQNIDNLYLNIEKAATKSGKKKEEITLIAVSKTVSPNIIKLAYDLGISEFGENKVQELLQKQSLLDNKIKWHMIGHLQKNKVKSILDHITLIHSIDNIELLNEIEKRALAKNIIINVLIQVNISKEKSKFGIDAENLKEIIYHSAQLEHINVKGLMTIAPFDEKKSNLHSIFAKLRDLSIDIKRERINNIHMDILSMGMSSDYDVAIQEGATHIRIGSAIFGMRNY